jgi:hypothetical protein
VFTGDRTKTKAFLNSLVNYFNINQAVYAQDHQKVIFTLSYMAEGEALDWANNWLATNTDNQGNINYGTWNALYTQIETDFAPVEKRANAIHSLNNLNQGTKNAEEHVTNFKLLITQAEIPVQNNDIVLIDYFTCSLNPRLAAKILNLENVPITIQGWYDAAIRFDGNYRRMRALLQNKPLYTKNSTPTRTLTPKRDPNAMEIDFLLTEERKKLMEAGKCFYCKEAAGHIARDCPKKPQRPKTNNPFRTNTFGGKAFEKSKSPEKNKAKQTHANIRAMMEALDDEEKEEVFKLQEEDF